MRVATWNVNSLRVRLPQLERWLDEARPDVLCLQETKLDDDQFPADAIRAAGYPHLAWWGDGAYNGVALLSKHPLEDVQKGLDDDDERPAQPRLIGATVRDTRILGLYVPNGQAVGSESFAYKLRWLDRLRDEVARRYTPDRALLLCGDFNIAPDDVDVWDPFRAEGQVLCHPEERGRFAGLLDWGLVDVFRDRNPFASAFSWWDYQKMGWQRGHGMRIDHILLTRPLLDRSSEPTIHQHVRGWDQPSDHAPVSVMLA